MRPSRTSAGAPSNIGAVVARQRVWQRRPETATRLRPCGAGRPGTDARIRPSTCPLSRADRDAKGWGGQAGTGGRWLRIWRLGVRVPRGALLTCSFARQRGEELRASRRVNLRVNPGTGGVALGSLPTTSSRPPGCWQPSTPRRRDNRGHGPITDLDQGHWMVTAHPRSISSRSNLRAGVGLASAGTPSRTSP
jgi:hypothetical protein